jgi:NPCBM/NEW2 domain
VKTYTMPIAVPALMLFLGGTAQLRAWSEPIHKSITLAAMASLPEWQQKQLLSVRDLLATRYVLIPDIWILPENRKEFGPLVILPNGDRFTHEPHGRDHNALTIGHYVNKTVESFRAGRVDEGARWAGCLLHFLEDCGSPAHSFPGDNQLSMLQDMIPVPPEFRDRALHGFVESGEARVSLGSRRPRLLGTGTEETTFNLIERLNELVRNARGQLLPILQGVFRKDQAAIDAGRVRAAEFDAAVVADALYTLLSIAAGKTDQAEAAALETRNVESLTPLEVFNQAYYPQFSYFSDPYFGHPLRDGILAGGETRRKLALKVAEGDAAVRREYEHGIGAGTYTRLTWALPAKVYDRFEALTGLHADLGGDGKITVRVFVDGQAAWYSGEMAGGDAAQRISVPVWGAREVSLSLESRSPKKGGNYVVVADPVLRKAKTPPPQGRTQ